MRSNTKHRGGLAMGAAVQLQSVERFVGAPVRKMLIDGKWVEAASGKTFETVEPRHRRGAGAGGGGRQGGRRSRRQGRASQLRRRQVGAHEPDRAPAPSPEDRRADRGERRRAGAARDARQRQAAHGERARRRARCRRDLPLLRGLGQQDRRRDQSRRRGLLQLHAARAGRCVRADHSLELPAADGGVEARRRRSRAATPSS